MAQFPPEFRSPIPLDLVERLESVCHHPGWAALQEYLRLHKENAVNSAAQWNHSSMERLAIEAAGQRAIVAFIQGLENLPEMLHTIRRQYREFLDQQRLAELVDMEEHYARAPNRMMVDEDASLT